MDSHTRRYADHVGPEKDLDETQRAEGILRRIYHANSGDTIQLRRPENDHERNHSNFITSTNPTLISLGFFLEKLIKENVITTTEDPYTFTKTEKKWIGAETKAPDFNHIYFPVQIAWEEMERESISNLDISNFKDLQVLINFQLRRLEPRIQRAITLYKTTNFRFDDFLSIVESLAHLVQDGIKLPIETGKSTELRKKLSMLERFFKSAFRQHGINNEDTLAFLARMTAGELLELIRHHPSNFALSNRKPSKD